MIRRLTKRERVIFILCVIMAGIYIGYNLVVRPVREAFLRLDRDIGAGQRRLAKSFLEIRKSVSLDKVFQFYEQKFKQSRSNEETMASILAEIEGVSVPLHLQIANLSPKRVREGEFYNRFSVSLTIDGNFVDILEFLHILQSEPHLFDVEEARFDKG
ncbi:MAG: type 4a pilus biogenesis protein PilO, partial [Candidatus Omnitrophica bacterium]|nr:type 4a pilus biogenesis protein PilO [Candidatus Omnitrophota bacterium]